ncbi:MAG TPA: RES family NAD+ phosphorylase [Nitrospiraceae bacterium]|nr:RES family NAD+ phosphorylase [Nitrospiraceae bacterium]
MSEFESQDSYRNFEQSVKRKARYVFEEKVNKFLQTVLETSDHRKRKLPKDRFLWRAQQGEHWATVYYDDEEASEDLQPLPPERMKPLTTSAREGRANPKGIPCLYLATDKETAMAEVRPWISSPISVSQFKTMKDLVLVDCSVEHAAGPFAHIYFKEPPPPEREKAVWAAIDYAFSEPVTPDDSTADYAPTQILAEAFRGYGYDGIIYKSLLGKGFNVALFDLNAAELVNGFLYRVKSIDFHFDEAANPYSVSKPAGKKKKSAPRGTSKRLKTKKRRRKNK